MIWLLNALPSLYSAGFICTSCPRLCYVRPVLFLTLNRNNIPLRKFLRFPIVFVYRQNTGTAVSKGNTLFLSAAPLSSIGQTKVPSCSARISHRQSERRVTDSSVQWCMQERCLWGGSCGNMTCLFFPPPDWHRSWLMFSYIWTVIKSGMVSDRQMGFVLRARIP